MGFFLQTLRTVIGGTVLDFLYTPIWWYTRGLWRQLRGVWASLSRQQRDLAVDVWLKNLFVPMYGQYDITGRIISFFMRLAQIIGRTFILMVWTVLCLVWLAAWVFIPVGVAYLIWTKLCYDC